MRYFTYQLFSLSLQRKRENVTFICQNYETCVNDETWQKIPLHLMQDIADVTQRNKFFDPLATKWCK